MSGAIKFVKNVRQTIPNIPDIRKGAKIETN